MVICIGSTTSSPASFRISGERVALKNSDWRVGRPLPSAPGTDLFGGSFAMIRWMSGRKPMSSMRSASSRTNISTRSRYTTPCDIRSIRRPGVAMTVSAPFCRAFTCGNCETPPNTTAKGSPVYFENVAVFSAVCAASSRVGERMSARGCPASWLVASGWLLVVPANSLLRIGSMNAAVLPVPVWAQPMRSRPSSR